MIACHSSPSLKRVCAREGEGLLNDLMDKSVKWDESCLSTIPKKVWKAFFVQTSMLTIF